MFGAEQGLATSREDQESCVWVQTFLRSTVLVVVEVVVVVGSVALRAIRRGGGLYIVRMRRAVRGAVHVCDRV